MKINSIIDIVGGELLNSPSISFIYNIKTDPKKVIEGDLFIATSLFDIEEAIHRGAFAIIIDANVKITDNEIAWIRVDSINNSLIKLFRFKLSCLDLTVFYCDEITFELLKIYKSNNKNIQFISNNLEESINIIENVSADDIFFSCKKELLNKIYPHNSDFNKEHAINNLIEHSLFETTFSYEDFYFPKLKIPSLYINQFLDVFTFFKESQESLDLNRVKKVNNFKPLFVDKFLSLIEYGKSDKFILVQENQSLIHNEIQYIKKRYKYAKTIYITRQYVEHLEEDQHILPDLKSLKDFLKDLTFNCIYIIGYSLDDVEYVLSQSSHTQTLL